MKPITITRANHKAFCEETDLSKEEWHLLFAMRRQIYDGDLELRAYVEAQVEREQLAEDQAGTLETSDWSNMVAFNDACIRLQRAQIAACREWQERK